MARAQGTPGAVDIIEVLARAGYAARGVVYLLIGGLAVLAVVGSGGRTTGSRGALETLASAPLGDAILIVMGVGLLGYALWRSIQAGKDTDHHGTDAKGIAIRVSLLVSAIFHAVLAVFVFNLLIALGSTSSSGGGSETLAGQLMSYPLGRLLVGGFGAAIIAAGVAHCIKGWKTNFDRYLIMSPSLKRKLYPLCRFGLVIRGVVMMIIGAFFVGAAYHLDPSEAGGLKEVFDAVRQQTYGTLLLAIVATGLLAFGLYSLLESKYRRVNPSAQG